jgi:hypothetical protein
MYNVFDYDRPRLKADKKKMKQRHQVFTESKVILKFLIQDK